MTAIMLVRLAFLPIWKNKYAIFAHLMTSRRYIFSFCHFGRYMVRMDPVSAENSQMFHKFSYHFIATASVVILLKGESE